MTRFHPATCLLRLALLCHNRPACTILLPQIRAAEQLFTMRLILFQALVLALACCAVAQKQLDIAIPPHPGANQFPAGLPRPNNPYLEKFYVPPPIPPNHYRGTYVSRFLVVVVGQRTTAVRALCAAPGQDP